MKITRLLSVLLVVAFAGVAYSGFTASNTLPSTAIGSGSAGISGYSITNVQYAHNNSNPSNVDQVSFTINPSSASYVKIKLTAAGSWYTCTNSSGTVTCPTTSPQANSVTPDNLTVEASD
jgi:hypothetical protein